MQTPDLTSFDFIVVNTSAGKDSQAMLDLVATQAAEQGVLDRLVVVHCDLGRAEWDGVRELAIQQAEAYGIRDIRVISRPQGDLLAQVEARGMWPSSAARYCTSDQKTHQVAKVFTALVKHRNDFRKSIGRPTPRVRILNCLGIRAQESPARAKKTPLEVEKTASNGKREVVRWLPIFDYTEEQVWSRIAASPQRDMVHPAYAAGMPRLSCVFCVMAPKSALVLAAQLNPEKAREYAAVEARIGHTFQHGLSMAEVVVEAESLDAPVVAEDWVMA